MHRFILWALTGDALLWRGVVPIPRLLFVFVFLATSLAVVAMGRVGNMDPYKHIAVTCARWWMREERRL